jgi:hypothetical protein
MKHIFIILAAAQRSYNAYLNAMLAQVRSEEVRSAFIDLGRETAKGLVESGLMTEAQRSVDVQKSLSKGLQDIAKITRLGFESGMNDAMAGPADPPSNEDEGLAPVTRLQ